MIVTLTVIYWEDGSGRLLWNIGMHLQDCMVSKNETNIIFSKNITLLWDVMSHNLIRKNQREVSSSHSRVAGHSSRLGCYTLSNCK